MTLAGQPVTWPDGSDERQPVAEQVVEQLAQWLTVGNRDTGDVALCRLDGSELLASSSFALNTPTASGGLLSFWGGGAVTHFDGREGELSLDGEVTTWLLGADWHWGHWPDGGNARRSTAGLVVSRSSSSGGYGTGANGREGEVDSTLTGAFPWARHRFTDRLEVWGAAGYGWLVVNQLAIQGNRHNRRPDVVVYLNGLPVAVVELKNPANQKADIWAAFRQLQTYKTDIPELFVSNVLLVISDGLGARGGSLSAAEERFLRWRIIDHPDDPDPLGRHRDLETMVRGLFQPQRLLAFIRSFCLFEENGSISKKIAAYHQFHAVRAAAEQVVRASRTDGDKKGGVVWHTQGSGKSIEMAFLSGTLLTDPRLENPTLVFVTDRQDLDGQLFGVFAGAGDLLGETPRQAENRQQLRHLLGNRPSGGIIFTTMQKFALRPGEHTFPVLSDRHNIVVICDEAHRTQYGLKARLNARTGIIRHGLPRPCGMPCHRPPSWPSPEPPCPGTTGAPGPCLGTMSLSTTSSKLWRTEQRWPFIMSPAWPNWPSRSRCSPGWTNRWMNSSRMKTTSPRLSGPRPAGRSWQPWWGPGHGFNRWPKTWCATMSSAAALNPAKPWWWP